jgi:hypothetical protein
MVELKEPMATAEVRWVPAEDGGRKSGPPTAAVYAATAVFVLGGDAEVMPGWPASADQLSILIRRLATDDNGLDMAEIGFLAPDLARPYLRPGRELLVLEGPQTVAWMQISELLLPPVHE